MNRENLTAIRDVTAEWIQKNEKEIRVHPAWHNDISPNESEILLKGATSYTYLLRSGQEKYAYFISFVKEDGSIKHQFFVLEFDKRGWCYRNGGGDSSPKEITSKNLSELIPAMMHCDLKSCVCLNNKNENAV